MLSFDGLIAGEPDALVESFAAEPELRDPVKRAPTGEDRVSTPRDHVPYAGSNSASAGLGLEFEAPDWYAEYMVREQTGRQLAT